MLPVDFFGRECVPFSLRDIYDALESAERQEIKQKVDKKKHFNEKPIQEIEISQKSTEKINVLV
ncbi:hypothetical protein KDD93_08220 [Campylobacter sp. faydin G-24]|uniref:Uncharacterized protein n=1 Tax=Campylobacter anatolicus TaxID=2829105 RepID=A0ABS5HL98_9BACT|nr:hypothetical protein [Campylobacter anatolicus]MBR8464547.1 hypothetical protein [Campylobacter anatolicus]